MYSSIQVIISLGILLLIPNHTSGYPVAPKRNNNYGILTELPLLVREIQQDPTPLLVTTVINKAKREPGLFGIGRSNRDSDNEDSNLPPHVQEAIAKAQTNTKAKIARFNQQTDDSATLGELTDDVNEMRRLTLGTGKIARAAGVRRIEEEGSSAVDAIIEGFRRGKE